MCIVNGLAKSHAELANGFIKVIPLYDETLGQNTGLPISIATLIGEIIDNWMNLDYHVVTSNLEFEAYISMARNTIEKIALLNHIQNSQKRVQALDKLIFTNSQDIRFIYSSGNKDVGELENFWMNQNSWTKSRPEDRIVKLKDNDLLLVYGYASRLIHGLNRDSSLKDDSDKYLIAIYSYLVVIRATHAVLADNTYIGEEIRKIHSKTATEAVRIWEGIKMTPHYILMLSSFSVNDDKLWSKAQLDFIKNYKVKLLAGVKNKKVVFPNYI